jgi:UDP-N-acetylmuramoyl-tripeptide--D-alanyl-D-alanine ligase
MQARRILEGFGSVEGVAKAKGEIIETLQNDGIAVINHDDAYFEYWKSVAGERRGYVIWPA